MAIIALGVGFFSGLKMTKPDMMNTISNFLDKGNFYDLHLLSTLGYTDDDVDSFAGEKDVLYLSLIVWTSYTRTRVKMTGC